MNVDDGGLICGESSRVRTARAVLRDIPIAFSASGAAIQLVETSGLRDRRGPVHAGAFLRERRIAFDCTRAEFPRIFVHELFHFAWVRAGNAQRRSFEELLASEQRARASGELGWSAEWRRQKLEPDDSTARNRRWREYCCESFCDTAAWLYSGALEHDEFTLGARHRARRRAWFRDHIEPRPLSI